MDIPIFFSYLCNVKTKNKKNKLDIMNTKTATKTNAFLSAVGFKATTLTENGAVTNVC